MIRRPPRHTLTCTHLHYTTLFRSFPMANCTGLDVWQYIRRGQLALPSIYDVHQRDVGRRNGLLVPVTPLTPPRDGERVENLAVRFRTVGDISCTCPVASGAADPTAIIEIGRASCRERVCQYV